MATGVTSFPTALDTAASLLSAVNNNSSLLNVAVSSSATTLEVVDGTLFATAGVGRLDDEYVIWDGKTGNQLTTVTRGAFGSTAASHSAGAEVRASIIAIHHNVLKDAVIAVETKLGTGSDVAANNEVLCGTGSGTSAWSQISNAHIADDAVTFTKMLNSTAASVLIGRGSASGAGDFQEITLGSGLTMTGTTLSASGSGAAWSAITDPSGNLSLAMAANLTTLTWAGNFAASSAFKLAGNNTTATGPLFHLTTAVSNLIPPLLVEVRGANTRLKVGHLGDVLVGQAAMGSTDTDGFPYIPTIGSNSFPTSTPTGQTGMSPIVAYSNGINGEYDLAVYLNSAWRAVGGARKRYDTSTGTGAQTIDFNSCAGDVTRQFTFGAGNATFTFSNPPPAGTLITMILVQDGTGMRTATWPGTVKWVSGVAPTLTITASAKDVFQFVWDGSSYLETGRNLDVK